MMAAIALSGLVGVPACAQDSWNPFRDRDQRPVRNQPQTPPAPPIQGPTYPDLAPPSYRDTRSPHAFESRRDSIPPPVAPGGSVAPAVIERGELAPVMATDGSKVPAELGQGLDVRALETLVAPIELPVRSPALAELWRRAWTAQTLGPKGGAAQNAMSALRLEILYRSGRLADLQTLLARADGAAAQAMVARIDIALGQVDQGCRRVRDALRSRAELAPPQRAALLVAAGYCAVVDNNAAAAGLTAELIRSESIEAPLALAALDTIAAGGKPKLTAPRQLGPIDYRFLAHVSDVDPAVVIERATPPLLGALALDARLDQTMRIPAAEAAARLSIIDAKALVDCYRAARFDAQAMANPLAAQPLASLRRALLFQAAEAERTPFRQVRLVRALLDDAARHGLQLPVATALGPLIEVIRPVQEIGWFAETAIEILIAAGRLEQARRWIEQSAGIDPSAGPMDHWLALADIADPSLRGPRGASLSALLPLAQRGRFSAEGLHRLATVLDALDYQVPIPLWELASRSPQPSTGYLPPTGVLSELQAAAKRREFARTVLLSVRAMGPSTADGAHMIALGDVIRALKRAGLEPDARLLGLEALFRLWPRRGGQ